MSEEKLRILEMLKEGKISTDEALELLKQVPDREDQNQYHRQDSEEWESRYSYTPDLNWIDDLKNAIKETAQNAFFPGDFLFGSREEHYTTEANVGNGINSLVFEGKNAPVTLLSYVGDKIDVEANFKVKNHWNPHLGLTEEGGVFTLTYDSNALHYIGIKVRVPQSVRIGSINLRSTNAPISVDDIKADRIELNTKNAPIKVSDVQSERLYCETKNAHVTLDDINAQEIEAQTTNAKISLDDVVARRARLNTSNAKIDVKDSSIAKLWAETSNAHISIDDAIFFEQEQDCGIDAITSNGGISLRLPRGEYESKLRASTSHGSINNELGNLIYRTNEKNYLEAATAGYEQAQTRLSINLQTSNSSIYIKR